MNSFFKRLAAQNFCLFYVIQFYEMSYFLLTLLKRVLTITETDLEQEEQRTRYVNTAAEKTKKKIQKSNSYGANTPWQLAVYVSI